jgi:hypothetical protein
MPEPNSAASSAGTQNTDGAPAPAPPAASGESETFTKEQIEALIKDRLDRQRAQFEAQRAQAERQAHEAALVEQQKWQELAEQRAAELAKLTPVAERVTTLEALMSAQISARSAQLPPALRELEPVDAPIEQRLTWLEKAQAAAAQWAGSGAPGAGGNPRPADYRGGTIDENIAALRARGGYSPM